MIALLLATYNGALYLPELLDSLLGQTCTDWHLWIRDDGSTDATVSILARYCEQHPTLLTCLKDDKKQLGAMRSFEALLQNVQADYYFFVDQDDVWEPQKIEQCVAQLKACETQYPSKPIIVHTDLSVVDASLHLIAPSYWRYANLHPEWNDHCLPFLAISNTITGCAMAFNQRAKEVSLPFYKEAYMHDAWMGLATLAASGEIVRIDEPLVQYRQHGDNVYGAEKYRFGWGLKAWKRRYTLAKRVYRAAHPLVFKNIGQFLIWKFRYFKALHL